MSDFDKRMEFNIGIDTSDDENEEEGFKLLEVKSNFGNTQNSASKVITDKNDRTEDVVVPKMDSAPNINLSSENKNDSKISCYEIIFYIFVIIFGLLHFVLAFALIYDFEKAQKFMFYLILGWILIAYIKVIID
uniref:Uncharacterized protein n=1 Tax=Panagrolaimus superbus TaxID=310955 RepID=A0A914YXC3_9BILA